MRSRRRIAVPPLPNLSQPIVASLAWELRQRIAAPGRESSRCAHCITCRNAATFRLGRKCNQGSPREDVGLFAADQKVTGFRNTRITQYETTDSDRGGIETRTYTAIHDVAWLQERKKQPSPFIIILQRSPECELAHVPARQSRP